MSDPRLSKRIISENDWNQLFKSILDAWITDELINHEKYKAFDTEINDVRNQDDIEKHIEVFDRISNEIENLRSASINQYYEDLIGEEELPSSESALINLIHDLENESDS